MNQQRFTLLRLPIIAVDYVIKNLKADDQYTFSQITKRTLNIMKSLSRRLPPYLLLFDVYLRVCKYFLGKTGEGSVYFFKTVDAYITYTTEFEDVAQEIRWDIEDISEVFNKPKISVTVQKLWQMDPMIEAAKNLGLKLDTICVKDRDEYYFGEYYHTIHNCKDAKSLEIRFKAPADFRLEEDARFSCDRIILQQAHWVTLDVMKKYFMDCATLRIQGCQIPFESLGDVVAELIDKSKIKELCIERTTENPEVSVDTILGDMPRKIIRRVFPDFPEEYFDVGYSIKMKNEEEILVCWDNTHFVMTQRYGEGSEHPSEESDNWDDFEGEEEEEEEVDGNGEGNNDNIDE